MSAPGQRPRHRARAGDARLLGRVGRARQRLGRPRDRRRARPRARAAGRGVVPAPPRLADARRRSRATTTASPTRACGRSATSRTRGRCSAPRTGSTTCASTSSSPTRCATRSTPTTRSSSCRTTTSRCAADDPRAAAARDDHHLLAHPVAERRALRHLPVARGAPRRAARQQHPRLPHAAALQQLHRLGRRVPRERASTASTTRSCRAARSTLVRPYPISIEWPVRWLRELPPVARLPRAGASRSSGLPPDALLGVGVDRLDYTKGIEERLLAVERLLERYPGVPRARSRSSSSPRRAARRSSATASSTSASSARAERINATLSARTATGPIVLLARAPRAADGVPLLPRRRPLLREQPARRHEPGGQGVRRRARRRARRAGAEPVHRRGARAHRGAHRQPVRPRQASDALATALRMPPAEQRTRMESMRKLVSEFNVYRWAGRMLVDAAEVRRRERLSGLLSRCRWNRSSTRDRPDQRRRDCAAACWAQPSSCLRRPPAIR